MKIYIDLLPQEKKKEVKRNNLFRAILREQILFLFPVVVFIVILGNIYYILNTNKNTSISSNSVYQSQDQYKKLSVYENEFSDANGKIAMLSKIQDGHLHWGNLFRQLSQDVPETITISNIATKNFQVFLVGKAKTRDELISFKTKLENDDCFGDINVPLSDLVVKTDVDFQLDFSITQDCLKK